MSATADRVIVLGIDGLSPAVVERLLERGQLPAFARLRDSGAYRRLATSNPAQSPVAWTTIATGANPGRHGVFDFIRRDPRAYRPELAILRVNPRNVAGRRGSMFLPVRHAPAFWNAASDAGVPSTVVRWPLTLPPDAIRGRMLAGLGVPDLNANLGRYTFYTTEPIPPAEAESRKGNVVQLPRGETAFRTTLDGPQRARVPLRIHVDRADRSVALAIAGEEHRVRERQWSGWIRVRFRVQLVRTVWGLCRFYLDAVEPDLRLYLTPIQADPRNPAFVLSHPDGYAAELAEAVGDYHTLGMPEDTNALGDGCFDTEAFLAQCDTVMAERERMLWHELGRLDRGLLAVVLDTTDRVQHIFWEPEGDTRDGSRIVDAWYRRADAVVGRVLEACDERTALLVCSDHGFCGFRRAVHLNSWLIRQGLMALKDGDRSASLLRGVNWSATRAYALGFSSIYLNRKGREGRGVVGPADAPGLAAEIARKLEQLTDGASGGPVVERVYRREEIYAGERVADAPDLIVGFRPGYRASWQTAVGGYPKPLIEDNRERWRGDHLVDPSHVPGILFLNRPSPCAQPSVADVAPAILRLLGLPPPAGFDGRSLAEDA
ncbi:MAG TPA: alkaline phosphatase family protein [Planctomycetota bacterium]|nr:alkaline phosphatase family protein [Planctomycetota bacterium]